LDPKPEARILPLKIAEDDPWQNIFKEACLQGKTVAQDIWKAAGGGDNVTWDNFKKSFYPALGVNDAKMADFEIAIKKLLRVTDDQINFTKFSQFVTTFSPLRTGESEGPAYISQLKNLCKERYFFGARDRNETQAILNCDAAKKLRDGGSLPFLVRLSESQNYQLVISHYYRRTDNKALDIAHQAVTEDQYAEIGYLKFIESYKKQNHLVDFEHEDRGFILGHKNVLRMQNNIPVTLGGRMTSMSSTASKLIN